MPRQRATSPTIYSELVKWDLTIWCFHESVLICFRCFRRIRSNTVILVLHIPLGTGTVVRLVSLVAQVCEFLFLQTRLHSSKDTKKPESSFLELSDFLLGTHIEPVLTHFEPPSLSPWLTDFCFLIPVASQRSHQDHPHPLRHLFLSPLL